MGKHCGPRIRSFAYLRHCFNPEGNGWEQGFSQKIILGNCFMKKKYIYFLGKILK